MGLVTRSGPGSPRAEEEPRNLPGTRPPQPKGSPWKGSQKRACRSWQPFHHRQPRPCGEQGEREVALTRRYALSGRSGRSKARGLFNAELVSLGSAITTSSAPSRMTVAPRSVSRRTSTRRRPGARRSRWTRFFAILGSGTELNHRRSSRVAGGGTVPAKDSGPHRRPGRPARPWCADSYDGSLGEWS